MKFNTSNKEIFSLMGSHFTHACSLKFSLHLSFQLENLNPISGLLCFYGIFLVIFTNSQLTSLVVTAWMSSRNVKASSSCIVGLKPMGFQALFGLSQFSFDLYFDFSIIGPLISYFEHDQFTFTESV